MTARVDFFCSEAEEDAFLRYMSVSGEVVGLQPSFQSETDLPVIDISRLPEWPKPFGCFLWLRSAGPVSWHSSRPSVEGATHGEFVNRFLASQAWDSISDKTGQRLLDVERSPLFIYRRSLIEDGLTGPSLLLCPSSNPDRVGREFAAWVRRCFAWIKRHSRRVHDWREPNPSLPNPYGLLNSIYAFPEMFEKLQSSDHPYAVILQNQ